MSIMKKEKNGSKNIIEHRYFMPKEKEKPVTDEIREVTIMTLNQSVTVISSYPKEDIFILSNLAYDILKRVKEEKLNE